MEKDGDLRFAVVDADLADALFIAIAELSATALTLLVAVRNILLACPLKCT